MYKIPVIVVFDVGKTNKKMFVFSENYSILSQKLITLPETVDEDGDKCEDIVALTNWVLESYNNLSTDFPDFEIKAINFSSYGASLVYLDDSGKPLTPIYNYLKPYPADLKKRFYETYGGEDRVSGETSSPVLDSLNSGMQLYRIKYEKPELFKRIKHALHLPQYLSYLITKKAFSDITSIGCHTSLWDFSTNQYHSWATEEGLAEKLAPIAPSDSVVEEAHKNLGCVVGIGLHDSSAALIPYLVSFEEPFLLLSTGTWCISFNPFNNSPLTIEELQQDCLSYIHYKGKPVKASRLFAGQEHEEQINRIAAHFDVNAAHLKLVSFNDKTIERLSSPDLNRSTEPQGYKFKFADRDLKTFRTDSEAYHQLILDIIEVQYQSTRLVLNGTNIKTIFVDGGFSKNAVYMNLLARCFPDVKIHAASMAQATAVGAALSIHEHWNRKPIQDNIIKLKYFPADNTTLA